MFQRLQGICHNNNVILRYVKLCSGFKFRFRDSLWNGRTLSAIRISPSYKISTKSNESYSLESEKKSVIGDRFFENGSNDFH